MHENENRVSISFLILSVRKCQKKSAIYVTTFLTMKSIFRCERLLHRLFPCGTLYEIAGVNFCLQTQFDGNFVNQLECVLSE